MESVSHSCVFELPRIQTRELESPSTPCDMPGRSATSQPLFECWNPRSSCTTTSTVLTRLARRTCPHEPQVGRPRFNTLCRIAAILDRELGFPRYSTYPFRFAVTLPQCDLRLDTTGESSRAPNPTPFRWNLDVDVKPFRD